MHDNVVHEFPMRANRHRRGWQGRANCAAIAVHAATRPQGAILIRFAILSALLLIATVPLRAAAASPEVGDAAPEFALAGSDGRTHQLADYRGRYVVLAWFPKVFTDG
jgi:hypothetical protein